MHEEPPIVAKHSERSPFLPENVALLVVTAAVVVTLVIIAVVLVRQPTGTSQSPVAETQGATDPSGPAPTASKEELAAAVKQIESLIIAVEELRFGTNVVPRQLSELLENGRLFDGGPYVEGPEAFLDPWRHRVRYEVKNGWVIIASNGPDGDSRTEDDISIEVPIPSAPIALVSNSTPLRLMKDQFEQIREEILGCYAEIGKVPDHIEIRNTFPTGGFLVGDRYTDPWGVPIWIKITTVKEAVLQSCGPDRKQHSNDDLYISFGLERGDTAFRGPWQVYRPEQMGE